MQRLLLYCCLLLLNINVLSQKIIDLDKETDPGANAMYHFYTVAGTPFVEAKFIRVVEGTPFFNDKVMKGAIILSEGREYRNMNIRLNLLDGQVNYIDSTGTEIIAMTPIKEVVLWDTINNTDFRFVNSDYIKASTKPEKDYYELLHTGNAELYKQHKKLLSESRPYGTATYEQKIETQKMFFVLLNGNWTRIKKLKDLTAILTDKNKEVLRYISENRLLKDNEATFLSVISYYNNLFVQQ